MECSVENRLFPVYLFRKNIKIRDYYETDREVC